MKVKSNIYIVWACMLATNCLSYGNIITTITEATVFGDVSRPGKIALYRNEFNIISCLNKAGFSFDKQAANSQKSDNFCRIFILFNEFQVAYDLPNDMNLVSRITIPDKCLIFVSSGSLNATSTNEVAAEQCKLGISEARNRLRKHLEIGSIESLIEFELICRLKKHIDILRKSDPIVDSTEISSITDKIISSEVSELTDRAEASKFKKILELQREKYISNGLGYAHPKLIFISKVIELLK